MSLSGTASNALTIALANTEAGAEVARILNAASTTKSPSAPVVPVTLTATSGTLPTAGGTATFALAGTPTVQELLQAVVDLQANVAALQAVLHAQGLTT